MRTGVGYTTIHDVFDGGTYEYQYSINGDEGTWHSTWVKGDIFRRERLVTPNSTADWDNVIQLVPLKEIDYSDGDTTVTVYEVYEYSIDGATAWHTDYEDADIYRRTGVVIAGELSEWSAPSKITGLDGIQSVPVTLYKLSTGIPNLPNGNTLYSFQTGTISGELNGWSITIPSNTNPGGTIWSTHNTALGLASDTTDVLSEQDWSVPVIAIVNGVNGGNGTNGNHGQGSFIVELTTEAQIPVSDSGSPSKDNDVFLISNRVAQDGDILTYQSTEVGSEFSKQYLRGSGSWVEFVSVVNGNQIINGTVAAEAIVTESITADQLSTGAITARTIDLSDLPSEIDNNNNVTTFRQSSEPTLAKANDIWFKSDDINTAHVYSVDWVTSTDTSLGDALITLMVGNTINLIGGTSILGSLPNTVYHKYQTHTAPIVMFNGQDITTSAEGIVIVSYFGTYSLYSQTASPTLIEGVNAIWVDTSAGNTQKEIVGWTTSGVTNSSDKTAGSIGGWSLDANYIWSGTKYIGATYNPNAGITLNKNGGIYAKQFYIDTNGNAHFKGTLGADTVTATQIKADTVTATQIKAGTITTTELNVADVFGVNATFSGTVYANKLSGDVNGGTVKTYSQKGSNSNVFSFTVNNTSGRNCLITLTGFFGRVSGSATSSSTGYIRVHTGSYSGTVKAQSGFSAAKDDWEEGAFATIGFKQGVGSVTYYVTTSASVTTLDAGACVISKIRDDGSVT